MAILYVLRVLLCLVLAYTLTNLAPDLKKYLKSRSILRKLLTDKNFRKLYNYATGELKLKVRVNPDISSGGYGVSVWGRGIVELDAGKTRSTDLHIATLSHEIGHSLEFGLKEIACPTRGMLCKLLKELRASNRAFVLLKNLGFDFDEEEFFKTVASWAATYLYKNFVYILRPGEMEKCPHFAKIMQMKIMKEILEFPQMRIANILNFMFLGEDEPYIPTKKIFR